ncbi:MAG TPA: BatA domain-containing protein [Tepidisphaeraceae bacterium]|nr:BatA domain-containing protein [Tepidisphaeraceae bacterium]
MLLCQPLAILPLIAPWFLAAGLGLVSIPILIHILNRRRYKVVDWAAMVFLLRAMKKNRRRLRFESLLLLLTRCSLLALLGLALARPFGCNDSTLANLTGRRAGLHVFVIDNAYSMSYQYDRPNAKTHLDQAKLIAKELIDRLAAGEEAVVVLPAAHQSASAEHPPAPTYDLQAAKAEVDRISQTYAAPDMAAALQEAKQIADATPDLPTKTLYLIDDSAHSAWMPADQEALAQLGGELADRFKGGIVHFNLGLPNEYNSLVEDLSTSHRLVTLMSDFRADFVAQLRAFGQNPADQPRLIWKMDDVVQDTPPAPPLRLDLSGEDETLSTASFPGGGPHVISASLVSDDHLPCDDTRWRTVDVASDLKMLIVEGQQEVGSTGGSGVDLHAALDPDRDPADLAAAKRPHLVSIDTISDLELPFKALGDYRCIALCGISGITDAEADRLEQWVRQGGALWIFMGPQVGADNYNQTLLKHHLLPGPLIQRITLPAGDAGREFDFNSNNPSRILEPFRGQQNTGLEDARVFSYWQVDVPAKSSVEHILDFQPDPATGHKDPAFTLQSLGLGNVVFCATAANADEEWTTFPAKIAYPEVMVCLFLGTVNNGDSWMNLTVGDQLQTPLNLKLLSTPTLKDPAGLDEPVLESSTPDGQAFYQTMPLDKPGVYTLNSGAGVWPISVNVPSQGGDVRLTNPETIQKNLGGIDIKFLGDTVPPQVTDADQGKDMGWSVMLAVLLLLAGESFMAMRFGRYRRH